MQAQEEEIMMNKGKRSKRPRPSYQPQLVLSTTSSSTTINSTGEYRDEEEDRLHHHQGYREDIEEDMAKCLILLAKGQNPKPVATSSSSSPETISYQCKTCSKSFSSFQALGGHRASHKERSTTAQDRENRCDDDDRSVILSLQMSGRVDSNGNTNNYYNGNFKKSTRVHECSICGAEFSSGQALGGHMRRHRAAPPVSGGGGGGVPHEAKRTKNFLALDLNLPAPEDQDRVESKYAFVPKEQVIVFSASSLVDCLY